MCPPVLSCKHFIFGVQCVLRAPMRMATEWSPPYNCLKWERTQLEARLLASSTSNPMILLSSISQRY